MGLVVSGDRRMPDWLWVRIEPVLRALPPHPLVVTGLRVPDLREAAFRCWVSGCRPASFRLTPAVDSRAAAPRHARLPTLLLCAASPPTPHDQRSIFRPEVACSSGRVLIP